MYVLYKKFLEVLSHRPSLRNAGLSLCWSCTCWLRLAVYLYGWLPINVEILHHTQVVYSTNYTDHYVEVRFMLSLLYRFSTSTPCLIYTCMVHELAEAEQSTFRLQLLILHYWLGAFFNVTAVWDKKKTLQPTIHCKLGWPYFILSAACKLCVTWQENQYNETMLCAKKTGRKFNEFVHTTTEVPPWCRFCIG